MLRPILTLLVIASPLAAQKSVEVFTGQGQRAETSLFAAEIDNGQFVGAAGAVFLTYGTPEWKPEYASQVDAQTLGKIVRLGKDNWATFDSSMPMTIGGTRVPTGIFYLALERDDEGAWSLVFIDPAKCKAAGAWPFLADKAPRTHRVTLKHEDSEELVSTLTVKFVRSESDPMSGAIEITWGKHRLTTPYQLELEQPSAPEKSGQPKRESAAPGRR